MVWDLEPAFDAAFRAALDHGKPVVYQCPPAGWTVCPLFRAAASSPDRPHTVVLVSDTSVGLDLASAARTVAAFRPIHVASGLARTDRLLRTSALAAVITTPSMAIALVGRSALKLASISRIVVAWPETLGDEAGNVDRVLGEASEAQRIVLTGDPTACSDFLERHARRAPRFEVAPLISSIESLPNVRYTVVSESTRAVGIRSALDILNGADTLLWDPVGRPAVTELSETPDVDLAGPALPRERYTVALAADLPTPKILEALRDRADQIVAFVRAGQIPTLEKWAKLARPLRLDTEVERQRDRATALRRQIRDRLQTADLDTSLRTIEPLLDEYDPALIAAAALSRTPPTASDQTATDATWTRLRLEAGRKDHVGARDIVGALVNAVGLRPGDIGRVDLRDQFALVEVRPEHAERVVRDLTGQSLRGKRITARLDTR